MRHVCAEGQRMTFPTPDKLAQNAAAPAGDPLAMDLSGLVMEPKLDGFRLLLHRGPNGVEAFTRTGKSQKGKIPHLEAALSGLPEGTWLDGELVYFDDKGMPEWGQVQSCMGSNAGDPQGILTYVVFDILAYNGLDIRPLPLSERRAALMVAVPTSSRVVISEQEAASHAYHEDLIAGGMEGTIVKDPAKPYASGKRGQGWTKFKANDEMDVVIMGYKAGENSFTGLIGAIEFGQYKDGVLTPRGRCSGMDMKKRKEISADPGKFLGQVISLAYMGIMPSGSPRHPQYKRFRPDKPAKDCTWSL
jgi:DNA ligase-1